MSASATRRGAVPVASWGRLAALPHTVRALHDPAQVASVLQGCGQLGLAFGAGRSYGDACLNPDHTLWTTCGLDRLIAFDAATGRLVCEAGVTLETIQRLMVPRGWMLPVTPGTQQVTVGGALAADVHGKNHHAQGTFGEHVRWLDLVRTSGEAHRCSRTELPELFAATIGGMGLTGVIVAAELQLRPVLGPWLATETHSFASLAEFFELADASEAKWEYTVAWLDCLSGTRGFFLRGNHAEGSASSPSGRSWGMPVTPPLSLVNWASLRAFNAGLYWYKRLRAGAALTHYEPFFYPLDAIANWNRMYGPRGFYQYQCVVPRASIAELLAEIRKAGQGSFLVVLKTFAPRAPVGMLSFPAPGVTLALDFPNRGASTLALFARLDALVAAAGGRIYLAKDACMSRALFKAGYPRWREFAAQRDPGISSALARRLLGT